MIEFKAKILDSGICGRIIKLPEIKRSHCDRSYFLNHPKFSAYINSDLFLNSIARELKSIGIKSGGVLYIDKDNKYYNVPACCTIDESGFLAHITIKI